GSQARVGLAHVHPVRHDGELSSGSDPRPVVRGPSDGPRRCFRTARSRAAERLAGGVPHARTRASDNAPVEPIASSGTGAVFRPTGGGTSEAAALLRDGRLLAAEVLARNADGTLLLAIGRH